MSDETTPDEPYADDEVAKSMGIVPDDPAPPGPWRPAGAQHLLTPTGYPQSVIWDEYRGEIRYRTIHEIMGLILAEMPAIGKTQRNESQKFNFRGIDDVLEQMTPLLGKYGAFYTPHVLERISDRRTTSGGSTMYEVNLHVRYVFHGPGGDEVDASGWGEGTDMGDKATSKAMTMAMKYVVVQVFAVATQEQSQADGDRYTPEETTDPRNVAATEGAIVALLDRLRPVLDALGGYPEEWRNQPASPERPGGYKLESLEAMVIGDRPRAPQTYVEWMLAVLDRVEMPAAPAAADEPAPTDEAPQPPCELCGSTRAQRVEVEGVLRCSNPKDCEARAEKRAQQASDPPPAETPDTARDDEPAPVDCTGCGQPIGPDEALVWDDAERPFHAEHLETL